MVNRPRNAQFAVAQSGAINKNSRCHIRGGIYPHATSFQMHAQSIGKRGPSSELKGAQSPYRPHLFLHYAPRLRGPRLLSTGVSAEDFSPYFGRYEGVKLRFEEPLQSLFLLHSQVVLVSLRKSEE